MLASDASDCGFKSHRPDLDNSVSRRKPNATDASNPLLGRPPVEGQRTERPVIDGLLYGPVKPLSYTVTTVGMLPDLRAYIV
jgi:hypothetical protein